MEKTEHIDKQIHADELKLRILMTDGCNKNCSFCLNDFQSKPGKKEPSFLDQSIGEVAIQQYVDSFKGKYPLQVYFSGGEPTLHEGLTDLMSLAKSLDCRVTLNTNGDFPESLEAGLLDSADTIHFGTYEINGVHAKKVSRMKGIIQCIYPHIDSEFIKFYSDQNIPIKVFRDFYDTSRGYTDFTEKLTEEFPDASLSFRHTGVQENRGRGCNDCEKTCITLKAAWIFPDGGTSPCPQEYQHQKTYPKNSEEWANYFSSVETFHKI